MRELKFRVWDKLEKRFIYPDKGYQGHYILTLDGQFHNLQNGSGGNECIVQQYTGLKDSNDVEICEGDIVNIVGDYPFDENYPPTHKIEYNCVTHGSNSIGSFILKNCHDKECIWRWNKLLIIGNIFQNPELLK